MTNVLISLRRSRRSANRDTALTSAPPTKAPKAALAETAAAATDDLK